MSGSTGSSQTSSANDLLAARLTGAPDGIAAVVLALADAGRVIASKVQRARIDSEVVGAVGATNVQGEEQQKLDVLANDELMRRLGDCPSVAVCASEEEEKATVVRTASEGGRFAVLFDPLDGSSNIDVGVGVGTIFSVLPNDCDDASTAECAVQNGEQQTAAGYLLYGSQVALVVTWGEGVDMYVLDPVDDRFVPVIEGLAMPEAKKLYSINEAYAEQFPSGIQRYLAECHESGYGARYIGSMVADVHRTLLKGGVFLYPQTTQNPEGKLRLLYEANPMAFVVEQAGGLAHTGAAPIMAIDAKEVHQRTPVIMGSRVEVERVLAHLD